MMAFLYVFIGGGLGSIFRYGISIMSKSVFTTNFPLGTLISNTMACAILAILVYWLEVKMQGPKWINHFAVIGFCGGFSTFSTFGFETIELIDKGHTFFAVSNVIISLLTGLGLIYLIRFIR